MENRRENGAGTDGPARLGVLIPAYEPGRGLSGLVRRLSEAGLPVVVVNDGSSAAAEPVFQELEGAVVLRHKKNRGKGRALKTGIAYMAAQGFEGIVTKLMTAQLGVDLEDIYLNGDESVADVAAFSATTAYTDGEYVTYNGGLYRFTTAHAAGAWSGSDAEQVGVEGDEKFLKLNTGWIKQFKSGGHVYDASSESQMSLDLFYKTLAQLPNKYNNGKLRWLMSPKRAQEWELYLLNKVIGQGGAVPDNVYTSPARIPAIECPSLNDETIMLTDPKNLIVVNSYSMKIRKTMEGKEAIMKDKRFYVIHLDFDPIVEELDATAIITGLPSIR